MPITEEFTEKQKRKLWDWFHGEYLRKKEIPPFPSSGKVVLRHDHNTH